MIPVGMYQEKLGELEKLLDGMGTDPKSVSSWFLESMERGQIDLGLIQSRGMQSIKLIESLPKTNLTSILGLKLAEPKRRALASEILGKNEDILRNEIAQIGGIVGNLRQLAYTVSQRIGAVRTYVFDLAEKAGGTQEQAFRNAEIGRKLNEMVLPTLVNLYEEMNRGIDFCRREHKTRVDKLHQVVWKRAWQGKWQGKNQARRRRRLAMLRKREADKKAAEGESP